MPSTAYPLATAPLPIDELDSPATVSYLLPSINGLLPSPSVEVGAEVEAGQTLCTVGPRELYPAPAAGRVAALERLPDVRGTRPSLAVVIEPKAGEPKAAFDGLDPTGDVDAMRDRIRRAAVVHADMSPRLLADDLPRELGTLVVLAADREPELSGTAQLLRERAPDAAAAARMLGNICGAERVLLAAVGELAAVARNPADAERVEVLALEPIYPASLEPMVAEAAGDMQALVISLETALTALDAVRDGHVQASKVITAIGPKGTLGNYRVPLGTRVGDLLAALKLKPKGRDKVIVGGPMRGWAQYSLDAPIDAGVDAILLVRASKVTEWSDEPCVNCGSCIDVCPVDLQVNSIGRYAEFGLFDRTTDLQLDACFECGLCAVACPARRPLLQLIRLAKTELLAIRPKS